MDKGPLPDVLPPLKRGLEAVQIEHEGKPLILLRDQEGVTDKAIAVSPGGFLVATLFNGKNTVQDIQTMYTKATGTVLSPAEIQGLFKELDKAEMLETKNLQDKRKKILSDFENSTIRKAQFAGVGYPDNQMDLAVYLGKFFQDAKGPKKELASPTHTSPALGLIAPHIDLERGGPIYAWAYQALAESPAPDVIVAFGVAHASPNSPWVFTPKEYGTPYGPVKVDSTLYSEFEKTLWYNPKADEWVHRTEHSLEFQSLWLKYIWRDKTPAWMPILCSSFLSFAEDKPPSQIETINSALNNMATLLKKRQQQGQKILILAGVDLAHVGPKFGDDVELSLELREKIRAEDQISLESAMDLDADGFYMSVAKDHRRRKVCGLSALYCALRLIKELKGETKPKGELLAYDQADDPMGGVVSFASAIFRI